MRKRFTAKVRLDGKTATSLEVPSSVVHALGPSRRPPVRITVGGHTTGRRSRRTATSSSFR